MSDSSQIPWSDNPYAPLIPDVLYKGEKYNFAGVLITAMFYGIVVVLFFRCMGALLDPAGRAKGGTKWGLVVHTTTMFSLATIFTGMTLDIQSICDIDNRLFPGSEILPPGPLGYQIFTYTKATGIVPSVFWLVNQWLADGLLLYRCYIIYGMNYWVIAFPSLMYFATWAVGIVFLYKTSQPNSVQNSLGANFGIPYYSITVALNVLLTVIIATRVILHSKNIRNALGSPAGVGGLYKAIVTMLVESSALYAVTSLLFIGPWAAQSWAADIFLPVVAQVQVIAPFLIILRVANRSAVTSETIVSGNLGSIHFTDRGRSTNGTETIPDGFAVDPTDVYEKTSGEPDVEAKSAINESPS